ncbi:hypothetical protein [Aestuariirhabdus sp. LZHN29]|uniref:hypothetical protein n=1 Tax=Aestuariirhabdus sp. LZHN29 TaxID=3417462 RepID=UPI003CF2A8AF
MIIDLPNNLYEDFKPLCVNEGKSPASMIRKLVIKYVNESKGLSENAKAKENKKTLL